MAVDVAAGVVDGLMERYCGWREQRLEAHAAYNHFTASPPVERSLLSRPTRSARPGGGGLQGVRDSDPVGPHVLP
jgi:hypothetical protein